MQSVSRSREVDRRADRRHGAELSWTCASPFAGQFQHQVPAHGKARQGEARDVVLRDQILRYRGDILRAAGMVERRGQAFCAAAIALVHPDHIHAQCKALGGNPLHVTGIARALKAVDDDYGQRALPVACQ